MQMYFGIPSKRRSKSNRFPTQDPLILLEARDGGKNTRMYLSQSAIDLLGLTDETNQVAFSFNPTNDAENFIVNANTFDSKSNLKVTKAGTISNKAHYNEIKNRYNSKEEEDLFLKIVHTAHSHSGVPVFGLEIFNVSNQESEIEEETIKLLNQEVTV